jgi:hypothetical protein
MAARADAAEGRADRAEQGREGERSRAGLPAEETAWISGHSTRVGSAQDMLRYGEHLPTASNV